MSSTLLMLILLGAAATQAAAQVRAPQDQPEAPGHGEYQGQKAAHEDFTPDQLDNLLSPIALYPDPLLAQGLLASTFPDQVDEAARFLRAGGPPEQIDNQPWDVSVKAVAHYPSVLYMMDNRLDWTTSVGQAYVNQSTDVQESIQRLRRIAYNNGALQSGPQIQVVQQGPDWAIWPANPQFIYVPGYDPAVVFGPSPFGAGLGGPFITYGIGFPIGAWCIYDFDWGRRTIFYHGWAGPLAPAWAVRALPYVHITSVYANERYRNVMVNPGVLSHPVNVDNLSHYNYVHKDVRYTNVGVSNTQRQAVSRSEARPQDIAAVAGGHPAAATTGQPAATTVGQLVAGGNTQAVQQQTQMQEMNQELNLQYQTIEEAQQQAQQQKQTAAHHGHPVRPVPVGARSANLPPLRQPAAAHTGNRELDQKEWQEQQSLYTNQEMRREGIDQEIRQVESEQEAIRNEREMASNAFKPGPTSQELALADRLQLLDKRRQELLHQEQELLKREQEEQQTLLHQQQQRRHQKQERKPEQKQQQKPQQKQPPAAKPRTPGGQ